MVMTHVLVGIVLGVVATLFVPAATPVAVLAGALGGLAPDLDLYVGHRRTLHFPVYGPLLAAGAVALAFLSPSVELVALAVFFAAVGTHAAMDVLGGGLELRPWQATSERAVYSHFHGRWLRPRRLVPYDGAPADLALAALVAAPALLVGDGPVALAVAGLLAIATGYTLLRRRLAEYWARLAHLVPPAFVEYLPARFAVVHRTHGSPPSDD
ncbi:metal-dependent hydrolase [Halomarina oriensis]|uniref:Metal-dependent hydrolase n=2 Tax=Halomarina oriensis TaxID=671145 RepID=A0A6B0GRQ7_9EURY|nr:metal-dependent hydrolase [Halomarina oriensis]